MMAEVLAIASAIAGLLSLSGTVLSEGYSFLSSVWKAPKELRQLLSETAAINTVLGQLQALVDDGTVPVEKSALKSLVQSGGIDSCFELLRSVQRSIARCERVQGQEIRNVGRMILWPFSEKETKDTLMKLSRLRENLHIALSVDTVYATSLTHILFRPYKLTHYS